ncbi:MAG: hypothetical protein M3405_16180 [Acidobacteriota bacterium]|nr:hypothetical protein [Acidobacteriota bacterium]
MNIEKVKSIADAVLYEGYILYPYRPSAIKNQQRWNFGGVYPKRFSEMQKGTDAWQMQTQCLIEADEKTTLDIKIRFLQMVMRGVREPKESFDKDNFNESDFQGVQALQVGEQLFQSWQEAVEREFNIKTVKLNELVGKTKEQKFSFEENQETEILKNEENKVGGIIVRSNEFIEGAVEVSVEDLSEQVELKSKKLFKVTVRILNKGNFADDETRDEALMRAFVSTHTILNVKSGGFVSLLEPTEKFENVAKTCENIGTYPVMVGDEGEREFLFSSPIILYDYPQIAPESEGNYFDGTEMDEMLALRIMTLTDDEKHQMRGADERTRQMLERTETMSPEMMMKLHGRTSNLSRKEENDK